jgi:transposase
VVDTNGLPVRLALAAGEAHDKRLADKLLSRLKSRSMLLADRGYDAGWISTLAANKGVLANIPPRCNRSEPICFSPCRAGYFLAFGGVLLVLVQLLRDLGRRPACDVNMQARGALEGMQFVLRAIRLNAK